MHQRRLVFWLIAVGMGFLITMGAFFLLPAHEVSAQCGSQASSCKNCHETQAQDPVNNDQTTWHGQHAFGDFCYLCHGGNNQATDKTTAHIGMVDPMKDIVSACKSCHANDYQAKAQVYATTLGVSIPSGTTTSTTPTSQPSETNGTQATPAPVAVQAAAIPAANIVDYTQRYNETVLGKKPVNIGNVILIIMIFAMVFGGGYFVLSREHIIKVSFQETKQIEGSYPANVVELVPQLARLNRSALINLKSILANPGKAGDIFALATKLATSTETKQEASEPANEEPDNN